MARPDPQRRQRRRVLLAATLAAEAVATWIARRRGYALGPHTTVRCHRGHAFTTIWIPGVSLKAVRLGWWRIQRCPAGPHWALVRPVRERDLSRRERRRAAALHDVRIP